MYMVSEESWRHEEENGSVSVYVRVYGKWQVYYLFLFVSEGWTTQAMWLFVEDTPAFVRAVTVEGEHCFFSVWRVVE